MSVDKGSQFDITPVEPGCPWADWARPNVKWCEDNLCAWITAPANTYSNLLYIVLGFKMIAEARRQQSATLMMFGPASILTGVSSLIFHASYTYVGQVFDFFGMFCFEHLAIVVNMRRLGWIDKSSQSAVYWSLVLASTSLVPVLGSMDIPYQLLVLLIILLICASEIYLRFLSGRKGAHCVAKYEMYLLSLALLLAGATCSALDAARIWCDPKNHIINGHSMWHLLTAASLYFFFQFYKQFAWDENMKGGLPVVVNSQIV